VHLSHGQVDHHSAPSEGRMDWVSVLSVSRDIGYCLNMEISGVENLRNEYLRTEGEIVHRQLGIGTCKACHATIDEGYMTAQNHE
jgi:sugar phosphate isomerase/epimerase